MSTPAHTHTDDNAGFATIDEALEDLAVGKFVVVVDDEDRENEGDLVIAAEHVTPDAINFMATHARGWICLALTPERCEELDLELMTAKNDTPFETPFTVTIEARRRRHDRDLGSRSRGHHQGRRRPGERPRGHRQGRSRATRCGPSAAASWSARATPRRPSTSPAWPAASRPASSARS